VGLVNYDLNRAALEVTALQQAPPQALLLQSVSACVWDGEAYSECLQKLYTALSFTGFKLGFVTERQLESGVIPQAPVVLVPGVGHLSEAAMAGLRKFTGRLVLVGGDDVLRRDDYGRERARELKVERLPFRSGADSSRTLHAQLLARLPAWGLRPAVELRGVDGQPVWGVEWRSAETPRGTVVDLCNYRKDRLEVVLTRAGRPLPTQDVLSGDRVDGPFGLEPLEVRLLR
jgi:hypothetical protein